MTILIKRYTLLRTSSAGGAGHTATAQTMNETSYCNERTRSRQGRNSYYTVFSEPFAELYVA